MQMVGQKLNLEIINSWSEIPQFIIIQGDRNMGKTTMVLYLCEKFNMHYVKMNNGINDVRELVKLMTPNSNTIYHFKDFDRASIQAKNALLKITEETPVGNCIIITGSNQIKTLESRARKLVMGAYNMEEVCNYMQGYVSSSEIQRNLFIAGINSPSKVEKYCKYDGLEQCLNFAFQVFNKITMIDYVDGVYAIRDFESRYKNDEVDVAILFLSMLIHIIEYNIINKQYYHYYEILNILIPAKESLERDYTLNRKFVIYRVIYNLSQIRGKI